MWSSRDDDDMGDGAPDRSGCSGNPATDDEGAPPNVTPAMVNERILTLMADISTQLTTVAKVSAGARKKSGRQGHARGGANRDPSPPGSSSSSSSDNDGDASSDSSRQDGGSQSNRSSDSSSDLDSPDEAARIRRRRKRYGISRREVRRAERTMRHLGLHGKKKKSTRKSGLALGAEVNVRHVIDWPHHHVRRQGEAIQFDQMSVQELTSGLLAMAERAAAKGRARWASNMRLLSHRVLEDAGRMQWSAVRRSIREVLLALEQGKLSWEHFHRLNRFRQTEMLLPIQTTGGRPGGASATSSATSAGNPGTTVRKLYPCIPYQTGECTVQQPSHQSSRGKVKHICAHCALTVKREYTHPESECRRKQGRDAAATQDTR